MKPLTYKFSKLSLVLSFSLLLTYTNTSAQGCVAVRHMATCSVPGAGADTILTNVHAKQWQISLGYRWLYSDRHFIGRKEQKHRKENNTEVINNSHSLDITASYNLTNRLTLGLTVPVNYNFRSSLYEHLGNLSGQRFATQSYGVGDIRLTGSYWLINPDKNSKGNIAIGAGIKAPTGSYNYKDEFHKYNSEKQVILQSRPVDQSIQLGDGGWGVNLEIQGFQRIFRKAFVYYNAFYLFNPRNTNGTLTGRKDSVEVGAIISTLSVPDQYMARAGVHYNLFPSKGLFVSLGGRIEGLPARDIIGKEDGFRRPGYIISAEPGLFWTKGKNIVFINVPVALVRDRIRSVYDIKTKKHGDAAFADFFVTATYARRF